jgi:phosphatidylglycerophosphatase A
MPDEPRASNPRRIQLLLLTAFGLGTIRPAPGTVASLATAGLMLLAAGRPLAGIALATGLFVYGVWATLACGEAFQAEGGHDDPSWVVSDEVAGQALACMAAIPFGGGWLPTGAAFLLFRLFDITKWGPVGMLEKLPGARGVLLDDLAAGGIAASLVAVAGALGAYGAF